MALESISTLKKNRVYAPIILGIAIFLLVFATRPLFSGYSNSTTELATVKQIAEEKQTEYDRLKAMEQAFQEGNDKELFDRVKKIEKDLVESDIFEEIMVNDYTNTSGFSSKIRIGNVSVDKGSKNPSGLYRGSVNMSISASSVSDIIDYLTYLVKDTDFAFTLDSINLPIDTAAESTSGGVSLSVTLGIYYYK